MVRVHPVTGKKILYVNPTFTTHIHGLSRVQSDALLAQLFALITAPEVQARFRWQAQSLAVWDNRSTQHCAVADFYPQHRKLHRITFEQCLGGAGGPCVRAGSLKASSGKLYKSLLKEPP